MTEEARSRLLREGRLLNAAPELLLVLKSALKQGAGWEKQAKKIISTIEKDS